MRVLFTAHPLYGHLQPLEALGRALTQAGHEVAVATAEDAHPIVVRMGLTPLPCGRSDPVLKQELARRIPDITTVPIPQRREVLFTTLFAEIAAPGTLADLTPLMERWQPDIVVHELAELAGAIAAAACGRPSVTHGYGLVLPPNIVAKTASVVGPLWRSVGLEEDTTAGLFRHAYLDVCPPSLQAAAVRDISTIVQPLRLYEPAATPAGRPSGWPRRPDRPTVYATLGTMNPIEAFGPILTGLAQADVNGVVTVGPNNDPAHLGASLPHITTHAYVPQAEVLPLVDAVICHAGSGTILGALAHGLPMVLTPQSADQFYNAAHCAAAGVAIALQPDDVSADAVAAAVAAITDNGEFRQAAQSIAAEIAAMPTTTAAVDLLVKLAA